jgi:hypothetical protein
LGKGDPSQKIAFTVPVYSSEKDGRFLGVLGLSVALGNVKSLQGQFDGGELSVLVDVREQTEDGGAVIVHHPKMNEWLRRNPTSGKDLIDVQRLNPEVTKQIQLEQNLMFSGGSQGKDHTRLLIDDYRDPFTPDVKGKRKAAFHPIFVSGKNEEFAKTGLVLIITENEVQ